jgi:hypothetical protein
MRPVYYLHFPGAQISSATCTSLHREISYRQNSCQLDNTPILRNKPLTKFSYLLTIKLKPGFLQGTIFSVPSINEANSLCLVISLVLAGCERGAGVTFPLQSHFFILERHHQSFSAYVHNTHESFLSHPVASILWWSRTL